MEYSIDNDLQFPNLKIDENILILYMIDLENKSLSDGLEDLRDCIVSTRKLITDGNKEVSPNSIGDTLKYNIANTALVLNSRKEIVDVRDKILIRIEDIIYKAVSKQVLNRFREIDSVSMEIHICERLPNDTYYYPVYKPYIDDYLNSNMSYYDICEPMEFRSTSVSALILQVEVLKKYGWITDFIRCIHGIDYQIYVDNVVITYNDGTCKVYDEIGEFIHDFLSLKGGQYYGKKQKRGWDY